MIGFLLYEGKVAVILLIFYLLWRVLLKKETFHRYNRIVLMVSIFISYLLPLCTIKLHRSVQTDFGVLTYVRTSGEFIIDSAQEVVSWSPVVLVLFVGAGVYLFRTLIAILSILRIVHSGECVETCRGYKVYVIDRDIDPFSWVRYIVMSRDDWDGAHELIMVHEIAHIRYGHSVELLLVDLLSAFQWFNPAVWMLRSDLQKLHEFEADEAVILNNVDTTEYLHMLVRKAGGDKGITVANELRHNSLRDRVVMLSREKSPAPRRCRVIYALPLIFLCIMLQARVFDAPTSAVDAQTVPGLIATDAIVRKPLQELEEIVVVSFDDKKEDTQTTIFPTALESMPSFQGGGTTGFSLWLNSRLYRPEGCKHRGSMRVSFVVNVDGSVCDIVVLDNVCESIDAMVVSLISQSPKWEPAASGGNPIPIQLIIPITFQIR